MILLGSQQYSIRPNTDLDSLSTFYTVDIWGCSKSYGDYDRIILQDEVRHKTREAAVKYARKLLKKFNNLGKNV